MSPYDNAGGAGLTRRTTHGGADVLYDLLLSALGAACLCAGKALVHRAVAALFGRLCPGPRPRRLRYRLGRWTLTLERED